MKRVLKMWSGLSKELKLMILLDVIVIICTIINVQRMLSAM